MDNPTTAFTKTFEQLQDLMCDTQSIDSYLSGTTIVLALLVGRVVFVANCGDSRLVVVKNKISKGKQITV